MFKGKKTWIFWSILALLAAGGLISLWLVLKKPAAPSADSYEKVLTRYYQTLFSKKKQGISSLVTGSFNDQTQFRTVRIPQYKVFIYRFDALTNSSDTNSAAMITYSLFIRDKEGWISYLNEAGFVLEQNQPRLSSIRVLYVGRDISR